jgi:hypothetical protein
VFDVVAQSLLLVLAVGRGDGVPKVEESVLLQSDVHEHGLETLLDVAHPAFVNAADDVLGAGALDGVFLQHAVLDHGDALFEFLGVDDDADAFVEIGIAGKKFANGFDHVE